MIEPSFDLNILRRFYVISLLILNTFKWIIFYSPWIEVNQPIINQFAKVPITYSTKTPENQRFSGVFRRYTMGILVTNELERIQSQTPIGGILFKICLINSKSMFHFYTPLKTSCFQTVSKWNIGVKSVKQVVFSKFNSDIYAIEIIFFSLPNVFVKNIKCSIIGGEKPYETN